MGSRVMPQDNVQAYMWNTLASAQVAELGRNLRNIIVERKTSE